MIIVPASASPTEGGPGAEASSAARSWRSTPRRQAGDIIVLTRQNRLYFVLGNGKAVMYRVATAKRASSGRARTTSPPRPSGRPGARRSRMRKRRPDLPAFMAGGPDNPLGARAIYLGSSIYRIHGTNEPSSIGKAASSGCIRMLNEDVTELYRHVKIGARVTVL